MGHSHALLYAAAIAVALSGSPALAQESVDPLGSGNGLLDSCTNADSMLRKGVCIGYISGASDALQMLDSDKEAKRYICTPAGVTRGQIRDVVIKYLTDHPQSRQNPAEALIFVALAEAFPCGK